ncbi:MAG TPA: winged helix DNA-binding domain-containing protein [Candidatus Dormibacteraeota bacterium]
MPDAALRDLRFARLRSQHLTDDTRLTTAVADVVAKACGLQAQAFDAARHQVRVRASGLTAGDVDRAFEVDRSVVRTWLMRGTLHLCAAEDLRWLVDLFGPAVNQLAASRRRALGLDDATCQRGLAVIRKALADGPVARRRIREALVRAGVLEEPVGQSLVFLLYHAAALGVVCCGPRMGRDDSFVLLDDWVAPSKGPGGDTALAELAVRYFEAFGPASEGDFAAWSGLRMSVVRPAMQAIGSRLAEFPGAIRGLWTVGTVASEPPPGRPIVRLLGHFDTFLLGYKRRDQLGGAAAEAWIHTGGGGWIRPVVLVDGWITGGWRLDRVSGGFEIVVTPFEQHFARVNAGIGREAASISAFLGRPVQWRSLPARD